MKKSMMLVAVAVIIAACGPKGDASNAGGNPSIPPVIPVPEAAKVTPAQFAGLKWLEGYWRGAAPGGEPFYERYVRSNDSTIAMYVFSDSTFSAPNDSAHIMLRGGIVRDGGRTASWVATRLYADTVEFGPEWGATNAFTWARDGDGWTATLFTGSGATKGITVYRMKRLPRP